MPLSQRYLRERAAHQLGERVRPVHEQSATPPMGLYIHMYSVWDRLLSPTPVLETTISDSPQRHPSEAIPRLLGKGTISHIIGEYVVGIAADTARAMAPASWASRTAAATL